MGTALMSVPRTAWLPANIDACAMYRMFLPHLHVPGSFFLFRMDKLLLSDLEGFDVVVVQRQVTPENFKALQMLRKAGKKIVYDLDDNVWQLPSSNPAQKYFKMMEDGFGYCVKEVNLITVSTQTLKSAVRTALPNIKQEIIVVPNSIDFDLFHESPLKKDDDQVIVGWAGSNTHDADMTEVCYILPELLENNPKLNLEFVGGGVPRNLEGKERVRFKKWVPVGEFANRFSSWSWDISMAPLEQHRFNYSKSCIKALESAAVKIPCLMSNVRPYHEFCALGGKDLEWLLCDSQRDWKTKLEVLINEPERRKELGDLMYKTAKKYFDIKNISQNWGYALRKAMEWN